MSSSVEGGQRPRAVSSDALHRGPGLAASSQELRRRHRSFVFPVTVAVPGLVPALRPARRLCATTSWQRSSATSTSACCFGLAQFVSTFLIATLYSRYANRNLDPIAERDPQRPRRGTPMTVLAAETVGRAGRQHRHLPGVRGPDRSSSSSGPPATTTRQPTTTPRGRSFTGPQNGIAISGDYLSAASFLGIAGAIAINGYDGFLYSIGFLVAWLVALLLVAELLRNTGRYTMADVLAFRLRQRPVRMAAAIIHPGGVDLLPARPDGRRRRPGRAAARRRQPGRPERVDRRRRRADDLLRARRRHEGHHLGADRQGVAAHRRRGPHDVLGAREVRLQPVRPARRRRRQSGKGDAFLNPGLQYGISPARRSSTSSRCRSRWCSARPACRTS